MEQFIKVGDIEIRLSNLDKVYWPEDKLRKFDLINYYIEMSNFIIPYIKDRPLVLSRYPDGIYGQSFYHKNLEPTQTPSFIRTELISGKDRTTGVNYIVGSGVETLIYTANLAAIELHPWSSSISQLDYPDWAIFDLDPAEGATFDDTIMVAQSIKKILNELNISAYPKTSGATGLHIYVPLEPIYPYEVAQKFIELVGWIVVQVLPEKATIYDRRVKDRKGKVYIDYLQNIKGKTITGVYSVRPLQGAPISTPLHWDEVKPGLKAENFNLKTIKKRINENNDLFAPVLTERQNIDNAIKLLMDQNCKV